MSRHRRLQRTLRSPARQARQSHNRFGRWVIRELRQYAADDAARDEKRGKR
jgi:hypothetical protein